MLAGTVFMAGILWSVRSMMEGAPPSSTPDLSGTPANLLFIGVLVGFVLPGAIAWGLLAPLPSVYRRGGLSLAASFSTVLASLLLTLVYSLLGRNGLVMAFALSLAGCLGLGLHFWRMGRTS